MTLVDAIQSLGLNGTPILIALTAIIGVVGALLSILMKDGLIIEEAKEPVVWLLSSLGITFAWDTYLGGMFLALALAWTVRELRVRVALFRGLFQ